ncbi:unnamed protein product [Brachionus calyciflorus]|uniref:RRM domain-containing protein n=1 Tax=Brachionus calyciflorus TaxID=104777 RepID=A0A813YF98_9BILA|nr:unnamed protein product [Brachionus calyciflorus]
MKNRRKNLEKKLKNKSNLSKHPNRSGITDETSIYIGNIQTNDLNNNEINKLINLFLNSNQNNKSTRISSLKVLRDCLYVVFENQNEAFNAAKFFDNYNFKNFRLKSYVINSSESKEKQSLETSQDEEYESEYDYSNTYRKNSIECEILVSNRQLKNYADTINERIQKSLFGINTFVKYSNGDPNEEQLLTKDILKDAFDRNLLYLICINQSNEQYNSLNLVIFNKWRLIKSENFNHTIKENKNVPSNKAFDLLKLDHREYLEYLKEFYSSHIEQDSSESEQIQKDSNKQINSFIDKNVFDNVLERMTELPTVNLEDIDFLTSFLNNQKMKILSQIKNEQKIQQNNNYATSKNQIRQQIPQINVPQLMQQTTQNSFNSSMQSQIPSLLTQQFPSNFIQTQMNFMQSIGSQNQQQQQIPSLMSIGNQAQNYKSPQPQSFMNMQKNFNNHVNTNNNNNHHQNTGRNFNNNFKRY